MAVIRNQNPRAMDCASGRRIDTHATHNRSSTRLFPGTQRRHPEKTTSFFICLPCMCARWLLSLRTLGRGGVSLLSFLLGSLSMLAGPVQRHRSPLFRVALSSSWPFRRSHCSPQIVASLMVTHFSRSPVMPL